MIRQCAFLFWLCVLAFATVIPAEGQEKTSIRKVVIDPGHGGKDPGAIGRKAKEKNVTLAIALKLGKMIRENMKDVEVIYTRNSDVFIELYQRAEIANENKADLFISIHCNANPSKTFQGAETYVMGLHKSKQNLEISKLENASILMEPDYLKRYDGFDPGSDESYITFSLYQDAFLNQSMEFAAEVQNELKDRVGISDRGVRQAGFLVLYKTTMPSVLIETGFISNPVEESYLLSSTGQEHIAGAIFRALKNYKGKLEKAQTTAGIKPEPENESASALKPKAKQKDTALPTSQTKVRTDVDKIPSEKTPPQENLVPAKKEPAIESSDVWFAVQVATSSKEIGVKNQKFKGLTNVKFYRQDGIYKYYVAKDKDLSKTLELVNELRKKGFPDSFAIALQGNKRITIDEAKRLLNEKKKE